MRFRDLPSPTFVRTVLKIVALGYAVVPIFLMQFVSVRQPDDLPADLWVLVLAVSIVVALFSLADLRQLVKGDLSAFSPNRAFVEGELALIAFGLGVLSTGSDAALFRVMLLIPLVTLAIIGDRLMIIACWTTFLAVLTAITWLGTEDVRQTVQVVIVYGAAGAFLVTAMSVLTDHLLGSLHTSEALARFAAHTSTAPDLPTGLEVGQVDLLDALDATEVLVFITSGSTEALPTAAVGLSITFTANVDARRPAPTPDAEAVRQAIATGLMQTHDGLWYIRGPRAECVVVIGVRPRHPSRFTPIDSSNARTVAALIAGVAQRSAMTARLAEQANTDALTGLANRRRLFDHAERELARARRTREPLCLAVFDLDRFKLLNDTWGHPAGDRVLERFAAVVDGAVRDQDLFARLGGEEFSLIVPTTALAGAVHLVDKLRQVVAGAVDTPDRHPLTFSAGVAEWHPDETLDDLFQRADAALYRAKASGRNQVAAAPGVVPKLPFATADRP